jgi:hypothetical protein
MPVSRIAVAELESRLSASMHRRQCGPQRLGREATTSAVLGEQVRDVCALGKQQGVEVGPDAHASLNAGGQRDQLPQVRPEHRFAAGNIDQFGTYI